MKPFYTKATSDNSNSISIRYEELEQFYPHWHYHDEFELVYIHKGSGIRYVGDGIAQFQTGDMVLLGSGLPHVWQSNPLENVSGEKKAVFTVIHIRQEFVHNEFFNLSMMSNIRKLFHESAQGISFLKFKSAEKYFGEIQKANSADKIIKLLELLSKLSKHKKTELLSSKEFNMALFDLNNDRLTNIFNFIIQKFRGKINLNTLADMVHMTPEALCSYFKRKTRKSIFSYIIDLRIGFSCKLLMNSDMNIEQVSQESGFPSTTFFNRKFKDKMHITPKQYRKQYRF